MLEPRCLLVVGAGRGTPSPAASTRSFHWSGLSWTPRRLPPPIPRYSSWPRSGRELTAAARTRSPGVMSTVLQRYADVSYIGLFSLGPYRNQLTPPERNTYYSGMVKFIGRYAATEAPKYTVSKVEWSDQSVKGCQWHHGRLQGDAV